MDKLIREQECRIAQLVWQRCYVLKRNVLLIGWLNYSVIGGGALFCCHWNEQWP